MVLDGGGGLSLSGLSSAFNCFANNFQQVVDTYFEKFAPLYGYIRV